MFITLNQHFKKIFNSETFFKLTTVWVFFTLFSLGITRSFNIIFSIQYSTLNLYIFFALLALVCFLFTIVNQNFFKIFTNFLKSSYFRAYLFTIDSIFLKFLEKNFILTALVMFLYFSISLGYFFGLIYGKDYFSIYIDLYPKVYVIRTFILMPVLFIKLLNEHPLFNDYTNRLYMGFADELGKGVVKVAVEHLNTPGGRTAVATAVAGVGADYIFRVHQSGVEKTIDKQDAVARDHIKELGSYDASKITSERIEKMHINSEKRADLRLEAAGSHWELGLKDTYRSFQGLPTVRQQSKDLQLERIGIEASMRKPDFVSFASSGVSNNPMIPFPLEKILNLFL